MFDLITNIVLDIIKSLEVDDLIQEGIIDHKDDDIKVQLYGLTLLVHTFNYVCLAPNKYGKLICRATNDRKSE